MDRGAADARDVPHQRMGAVERRLGSSSTVPAGCARCVFTGCRGKQPGGLRTLSVEGDPTDDVPVAFRDADGEVRFPRIHIYDRGGLRAVLQNRWDNGKKGGYYGLLHRARTLEIGDNPGALRDLLAYAGGTYPLGEHWRRQELDRDMEVVVRRTDRSVPLIGQLRGHLSRVAVLSDLGIENVVGVDCHRHVFARCSWIKPWSLTVNARLGAPAQLRFRDAGGQVRFRRVTILGAGSLRAVLQNRWDDGRGGGGYYGLLHHAESLAIWDNPGAVRDLVAYVEGMYQLGRHWQRQKLPRDMEVLVGCAGESAPLVRQLREHFSRVVVCSDFGVENKVGVDCHRHTFTNCRGVQPQSLAADARLSAPGSEPQLQFNQADAEVRVPELAVGPRGSLAAVVRNSWWNGRSGAESRGGRYGLLWHARALTIGGNPQAVRDLAAYVAGRYETGGSQWPARPPGKDMKLTIEGAAGCEAEVGALAEHLGAVRADGRKVLGGERRRMLDDCNARERGLRLQRAATGDRRRALAEAGGLLAGKLREVRQAQQLLRMAERRLEALVSAAG